MMEGLEIRGLEAGYGSRRIVNNLSLPCLPPGEVIALVGPNAAGKSTLMRSLAGLTPAQGEARLDGDNLFALSPTERAKRVSFMPQSLPSGIALNVFEGVFTALKAAPPSRMVSNTQLRRRAFSALEQFGIGDLALHPFDNLSGGQRQLASLAQATVREPRLLLLDEPTSALDLAHQIRAMRLVREYARRREAIVVAILHDLSLACRWADRIAVLTKGDLIAFGQPEVAITPQTLRLAYGIEARVEADDSGRLRIDIENVLPT
ncbi:ABC transporter ATP-binding protein [Rhizobium puerariae]|uniref:ABC transporter ATP-binding protein n=1 Tax=Rhizobium puerariae TaxID=1585791 RepID=A0ABV6AQV4_9HYPH